MNKFKSASFFFFFTILLIAQNNKGLPEGYLNTDRTKTNINASWKFYLGTPDEHPGRVDFDDSNWKKVSIPHTLELVSYELDSIKESWVQENYLRKIGWYRKSIKIDTDSSKKIYIEFEGVHNATELWVNGKNVGTHAINGYIPFHFDITNYVVFGKENIIAIKADNTFNKTISPDPHRTDYVKFGGLYRDLFLITSNKLHVTFNWEDFDAGVHITTPTVNKNNGTVSIKTTVNNENSELKKCRIETHIIDSDGYVIKKLINSVNIAPNTNYTFRQTSTIEDNFNLWSPDAPYLYRVYSVIYDNDTPVDFVENTFGFRTFSLEKGKGFVLNGEPLFLVGANRHQNYPVIGDAVPNSFHRNEALQYKNAGMNIIRLSHYTQDDAFIKACDELGIIIYEEVSTWIEWGDEAWFDKLDTTTRVMIRNHRNHPSIMFWGAGINHRGPVPRMQTVAKEEDPFRLTASASSAWNGVKNEGITDVHATMDYRRTEFPETAFTMVMEHGSAPNAEKNQFHISRYKASKNNIAAIAWLGADYNHLQKGDNNNQRDYMTTYGILSAYRTPKPVYYWYQSELIPDPIVHIGDETASTNGKVRIYSNCQEVKLYHNNKLIASQKPDNNLIKSNLNHPSFTFNYNWKEGELKAVGYNHGKVATSHSRTKQGSPYRIEIKFNITDQPFYADGSDLRLAHAYIVDKNGETITSAKNKIEFSISGAGTLVDNGSIDANPATPYYGIASIYVRAHDNSGTITVTAKSKGLKSGTASISTKTYNPNELENSAKPIYNYPISKVDIGAESQLVQFEWDAWTGNSDNDLKYVISDYNAHININADDNDIKWFHHNSAMLGDLSFVGSDGLYSEKGILKLTISNLKAGNYHLETYHHNRKDDTKLANKIEVIINDSHGKLIKTADDHIVNYYLNNNTGERKPLHIKSVIKSNGTENITMTFKNLEKGDIWLNGFILKQLKNEN
ncbi:glycoside hydrolase family 2 TIM barrel-domain containing protein [Flavivirga abyssicola]|uniref:glycoside hydrolase family 2 protein n=1 Tax=Flavivirga abyssicola TaxID=3063533 RepID=UPI0026DEF6C7|nr:sugar-binding domain-containing protein [Flavivirga sp. MEBiC07777]WVK11962.1 glycoside hydrolase family 2 TIM barrel-domain containing protein [Flavivirga sp. MEBiC07777]